MTEKQSVAFSISLQERHCRRLKGAPRFRCRACVKDFSITSGTLFGSHKLPLRGYSLNLGRVARAAQRVVEATWEKSGDRSLIVPVWRLVDSMRHMRREISERVAEVVRAVRARIERRTTERAVAREWHLER
jgi:hypothetical protein